MTACFSIGTISMTIAIRHSDLLYASVPAGMNTQASDHVKFRDRVFWCQWGQIQGMDYHKAVDGTVNQSCQQYVESSWMQICSLPPFSKNASYYYYYYWLHNIGTHVNSDIKQKLNPKSPHKKRHKH